MGNRCTCLSVLLYSYLRVALNRLDRIGEMVDEESFPRGKPKYFPKGQQKRQRYKEKEDQTEHLFTEVNYNNKTLYSPTV